MYRSYENYMEISLDALDRNARTVAEYVQVPVIGVLKCDGYGVSLKQAAWAWQKAGATMFAVSEPGEALELRRAGFREDILLLTPVADSGILRELLEQDIILTVSSIQSARFCCRYSDGSSAPRVHVAVDTGMGRFGVRWSDTDQLKYIYSMKKLRFEGIFSHFSSSFEPRCRHTGVQLERFLRTVKILTDQGIRVGMRHMANSCAALRFPQTRLDAVRVGSALVGRLCCPVPVELEKVGTFRAQVVERKLLRAGETTGYGASRKIWKTTSAIVVAVGQQNGFSLEKRPDPRCFRDLIRWWLTALRRPYVSWQGRRLPLVGRVGNQYTLFDASDTEIAPGDHVTVPIPILSPGNYRKFKM